MTNIWFKFKTYFPSSLNKWKKYFLNSLPIIFSAMIFSLNSFVDNFMSTNIEGGNQALAYANTWTEILIGIISLTTIVGSAIFAQYFGKKDYKNVSEIINLRMLFSFFIALSFAIPAWIASQNMIRAISGFDNNINPLIINNASNYLMLITTSWLINSLWYTSSMILRETHHGFVSFISSLLSLLINVLLNSIFIFVLNKGIVFLAYSTIISNVVSFGFVIIFKIIKDRNVLWNPFKFYIVSKEIFVHFFSRWLSFILLAIGSVAVSVRFVIWNIGYPTGTIGLPIFSLSAANILGITGMFFNIFWTTFDSINSNVAIFVGKELGQNNIQNAKNNAKELLGFHTLLAICMGLIMFSLSFGIEKMTFLAKGYKLSLISSSPNLTDIEIASAVSIFMRNIKWSLWTLSLFMPMFIWFITKNRVICSGGHTLQVAIVESISGLLQLLWLWLIGDIFNGTNHNQLPFAWGYFIFYLSDIVKFIIYEILEKKLNWAKNITINKKTSKKVITS